MLRALLVILAILSAVLGIALGLWFMYVLAALLLVATAGVWLLSLKGKFEIGRPDSAGYVKAEEEDLGALGILEIRPKQGVARTPEAVQEATVPASPSLTRESAEAVRQVSMFASKETQSVVDTKEPAPASVEQNGKSENVAREETPRTFAAPRPARKPSSDYQVVSSSGSVNREVVLPCLESLCAALEANTVCLLGTEAGGRGHRIHAIVSRNAYARGGGELTPGNGMRWSSSRYVTVERAADATWDPYDLQYYRETIAVKELAHVAVPVRSEKRRFILIADAMQDGTLSDSDANRIIEEYAGLLGVLLGREEKSGDSAAPGFRPRREIIAEEMERARNSDSPLSLALVMLNRAEEIGQAQPERVDDLENRLRGSLEQSADSLRVERFGDLMFGVFVWSHVSEVERWALDLQEQFEHDDGDLSGGVSIGAAMLNDRHSTPEQLRADAAAALQEAVKSGVCTILD